MWCDVQTGVSLIDKLHHDPHSPHEARVIGVMQNMKEFQEAFHCKQSDYLARETKCQLW